MSTSTPGTGHAHVSPWIAIGAALRDNFVPGLVLWCVGLALVVAYYFNASTHAALEKFGDLRDRYGLLVPVIGTVLCGAILPSLYLRRNPAVRAHYRLKNMAFLSLFWGYKGIEVEIWYRILARVVGTDHSIATVAIKSFIDQAIYCPFFAVPLTVLGLSFNHAGLRAAPLIADFRAGGWYRRHILPTLLANAIIWVPVVCLVYSLPLSLQALLFDLVLCFYILIVAHLTRRKH